MSRAALVLVVSAACSHAPDPAQVVIAVDRPATMYQFAGDARGLAWEQGVGGVNVVRYRPTGGATIDVAPVRAGMVPIAVDERFVYWGDGGVVWRWSRTDHRAERRAELAADATALLPQGDALWIGAGKSAYRIARDGDAGAPVAGAVFDADVYVRDFVVVDGRVAALALRYRNGADHGRTMIAWADERAAPITDVPWASATVASDGHTIFLCDWDSSTLDAPIAVWSMTVGHPPAIVPGLSELHDVAVNLHGADARGLYLSDGTTLSRRDPDGTMHALGRRMMHGELSADGVLYGTRHDADRRETIVRLDLPR